MVNTEIRLIAFFAAKDGETLYGQQKQDWAAEGEKETESGSSLVAFLLLWARVSSGLTWNSALLGLCRMKSKPQLAPEALHHLLYCPPWPDFP